MSVDTFRAFPRPHRLRKKMHKIYFEKLMENGIFKIFYHYIVIFVRMLKLFPIKRVGQNTGHGFLEIMINVLFRSRHIEGGNVDCIDGESTADGEEQIYWLRPKLRPSPAQSPTGQSGQPNSDKSWLNKKLKPKVTFNDLPSTSGSR